MPDKKQVIAVVLTDTHLHAKNIPEQIDIYKQAIKLAKRHKCEVFHGGDIFDSRKSQPLSVLITFSEILSLFSTADITLHAIPGNHDKTDYDAVESYLDCFTGRSHFELYREYGSVDLNDSVVLHLLPFFSESGSYPERLKRISPALKKCHLLLTHIAVNGVKNNDGTKVDNGLNRAAFKNFDEILVGHYHDASQIHNVSYIGSAFQHNYGESEKNKGFTIIYDDGSTELVQSRFKPFITRTVDIRAGEPDMAELFITTKDALKTSHVRIKFYGPESELVKLDVVALMQIGADVKLISDEVEMLKEDAGADSFTSWNMSSLEEELVEFAKGEGVEELLPKALKYLRDE